MAAEHARGAELLGTMDEPKASRSLSPGHLRGSGDPSPGRAQVPLAQLGGARADFVAALGRRVAEMATLVNELERLPGSAAPRDDLRRRIHALAAGARLLRFTRLAERACEGEAALLIAADRGLVTPEDVAVLRTLLEQVPALAWADAEAAALRAGDSEAEPHRSSSGASRSTVPAGSRRRAPAFSGFAPPVSSSSSAASPAKGPNAPVTALVIGPESLAACLRSGVQDAGASSFDVEHVAASIDAIDLARALAPDVIVLDTSATTAHALCDALLADPLTEQIPVLAVGDADRSGAAGSFAAMGVARTLARPVSPAMLERACVDAVLSAAGSETRHAPFGELTIDELGSRLAEELRRSLGDAAMPGGRDLRFDLAEGTEVLAALWGAVARIRDIVTIESSGRVRFAPTGPEGGQPIAPWVGPDGERRGRVRGESQGEGPSLDGKTVVVVDDDPAVTWFIAGVLRAQGVLVHEAHDGVRGLDLAARVRPDLVISDIVMPGIDGLALCRTIKRDVVLRDVPVLLLSWKEDLLQRVRELGTSADGYVRKEAAAPVILERVREVLLPRHRVRERLAAFGDVRGRLDGLSVATLLTLTSAVRTDATLAVRDLAFLYEVDLRGGQPIRATRTSVDGGFERGSRVLQGLLGVTTGRFSVTAPVSDAISVELVGTLEEQLLPHVARARACARLLGGVELMRVDRVELDEETIAPYLKATPEPARGLMRTLLAGGSPRDLITLGQAPARLVEEVLLDAAARGAFSAILATNGDDLLAPALIEELDALRSGARARPVVNMPELDLGPTIYTSTPAPVEIAAALSAQPPRVTELQITDASMRPPRVIDAVGVETAPSSPPVVAVGPSLEILPPRFAPAPSVQPPMVFEALSRAPRSLGSLAPPPVAPNPEPVASPPPRVEPPASRIDETPSKVVRRPSSFASPRRDEEIDPPAKPARDRDSGTPNRSMWALFAVAGIVFAIGARLSRDRELARAAAEQTVVLESKTAQPNVAQAPVAPTAAPSVEVVAPPKNDGESKNDPVMPQDVPLRADDKVPQGQGMLEVVAGTSDTIWIDGAHVGNGPSVRRALAPRKEPYEIRVKLRGEERVRFALVKEGRLTRIRIAPPWSR